MENSKLAERIENVAAENQHVLDEIIKRQDRLELDMQDIGTGGVNLSPNSRENALNKMLLPYFRFGDDSQIKSSMSVGSGPEGGYSVMPELDDILREVARDYNPVYDLARKETCTTSDYETLINTDLADVSWVGETEARSASSTPTLKKITIPVHEQSCLQEVTQRLVDDSAFDVPGFVRRNVATSFASAAGTTFISGNGVQRPMGILSYSADTADDDSRDWEKIQYVKTGTSGDFDANSPGNALFAAMYAMKAPYLSGAVWLMSRSTAAEVRKLQDAEYRYYWQDGLQAGQPNTLIGFPVRLCEDVPTISADSYSIIFANLSVAYCIPERPGVRFLRDPYTSKPYLRLYFTRRVGGAVVDFNAIKLVRFST